MTYNLVLEIEKDWGRLAMGCFEDIYDNFHQFVAFQIDQVFDSYENLKAPVRYASTLSLSYSLLTVGAVNVYSRLSTHTPPRPGISLKMR